MMIMAAQVIALYVLGCCVVSATGCNSQLWKGAAISTADCTAISALGCAMQMTAGCELPSAADDGPAWESYGMCLSQKTQDCAVTGISRCVIGALMKATGGPVVAGGAPCDQEAVDLCVMGSMCGSEMACAESVAACYNEVCTQ